MLDESGSPVVALLETMLVKLPLAGAVTTRVRLVLTPDASAPQNPPFKVKVPPERTPASCCPEVDPSEKVPPVEKVLPPPETFDHERS